MEIIDGPSDMEIWCMSQTVGDPQIPFSIGFHPVVECFLRTLAVVGFICLLLVGTLETQGGTSTAASKHTDAVGRGKLVHPDLNFNYMSKRRVPNGPDPIHNRRAGNSGRPPGQA
ncbi:hypothetical protein ACFX13_011681 [Malus domestica]